MKHKIPDFLCATFFLTCLLAFECRLNCKMDWSKDWLKFLIKVIPVSMLHRARNWRVISKVYYGQFCSNIVFWWGECQGKKTVRVLLWQGKGLKPLFTLIAEIHACSCREPFSAWSCLTQLIENRVFCGWLLPGTL